MLPFIISSHFNCIFAHLPNEPDCLSLLHLLPKLFLHFDSMNFCFQIRRNEAARPKGEKQTWTNLIGSNNEVSFEDIFLLWLLTSDCIKYYILWGLHSTVEAFLLPTQQPRVKIPAPLIFFSLYCWVRGQYWDWTHLVPSNEFHKCS